MDERESDTTETFGSQDAAKDVSNQNAEEHPAGVGDGSTGGSASDDKSADKDRSREEDAGRSGGAGEGSQATGHPNNAG